MKRKAFRAALPYTMPICVGFLFLGMSYGFLMKSQGFSVIYPMLMSLFIFAGSMEFVTVSLLLSAFQPFHAFVLALMVNARHLFYGISMLEPYRKAGAARPYLIFALTDETYSLVCSGKRSIRECLLISLFDQVYWVAGSTVGALLGGVVPFSTEGVDFALTALFLTVFTQQWLENKNHFSALCGVGVSVLCLAVFGPDRFLIPAMAGITALLLAAGLKEKEGDHA